jgi:hypothetical protein
LTNNTSHNLIRLIIETGLRSLVAVVRYGEDPVGLIEGDRDGIGPEQAKPAQAVLQFGQKESHVPTWNYGFVARRAERLRGRLSFIRRPL